MERRSSARIPFKTTVSISRGDEPSVGEIENISRHGIFIKTRCGYVEGQDVLVSVILNEREVTLSMTLPCAITRQTESGIGCFSKHLEPQNLLFMNSLIQAYKGDTPELLQSLFTCLNGPEFPAPL